MKKKSKQVLSKHIVRVARKVAEIEANSSCPLFAYQPILPDSVKRLRKF